MIGCLLANAGGRTDIVWDVSSCTIRLFKVVEDRVKKKNESTAARQQLIYPRIDPHVTSHLFLWDLDERRSNGGICVLMDMACHAATQLQIIYVRT